MSGLLYSILLAVLCGSGLLMALAFLITHRPRRWRSVPAIDASGWVLIVLVAYGRTAALLVLGWPLAARDLAGAVVGLGMSVLVDALLVLRLLAYAKFVRRDRRDHGQTDR